MNIIGSVSAQNDNVSDKLVGKNQNEKARNVCFKEVELQTFDNMRNDYVCRS